MIFLQAAEFMASFIEALTGIALNAGLLSDEKMKWRQQVLAALATAGVIWVMNQFWIFSIVVTVIGIGCIALSSSLIYQIKLWDSAAVSIVYLLLIYIIDFLLISFLGVVWQNSGLAAELTSSVSMARVGYLVLTKLVLGAVYYFLATYCFGKIRIPMRKVLIGIVLLNVMVFICVKNTYTHIDSEMFMIWLCLLGIILAVIYLSVHVLAYIQSMEHLKMAEERYFLLADGYQKEIRGYQKEQMFLHDWKTHYLLIRRYIQRGEFEKAGAYIEALNFPDEQVPKRTGIASVDILMEYKIQEAAAEGILVEIDSDLIHLKLKETEAVTLFGNLLDIAIESCKRAKCGEKQIRMTVRKSQQMTFMKLTASGGTDLLTDKELQWKELGLRSIRDIVERYGGTEEFREKSNGMMAIISFFS